MPDAPTTRRCGTMPVHERLLRTTPDYIAARVASENRAFTSRTARVAQRSGVTQIPVVVHVLWNTDEQNIDDAQIAGQIDALNEDYRKANPDVAEMPEVFAPLATDARVGFALATTDPDGAPTSGITRTQTDAGEFHDDDDAKSAATGGHDAWPADRYLNVWVVPRLVDGQGQDLLGYAQFPGGPAATDGVVILHTAPHLGRRRRRLQRRRPRGRHPQRGGPQHRRPGVPARHVQQRTRRRPVHELHGLLRRRRDVHVHRGPGRPHAGMPGRRPAEHRAAVAVAGPRKPAGEGVAPRRPAGGAVGR